MGKKLEKWKFRTIILLENSEMIWDESKTLFFIWFYPDLLENQPGSNPKVHKLLQNLILVK